MELDKLTKVLRIDRPQPRLTETLEVSFWAHPAQVIAMFVECGCLMVVLQRTHVYQRLGCRLQLRSCAKIQRGDHEYSTLRWVFHGHEMSCGGMVVGGNNILEYMTYFGSAFGG